MKNETKIAIVGGGSLLNTAFWKKGKEKKIFTPYGKADCRLFKNILFICRHGQKNKIPPHKINHRANVFAIKKFGAKSIFAFNSVGSLKRKIKPGDFLIPDDFVDFDPPTFFNKSLKFTTPEISEKIRKILIDILKKLKVKFWKKGIYFNTKGPRLETKAEINLIKNFADVVGMTMAKEATLARELDLEYASLCSIDNFGHGIIKKSLGQKEIKKRQRESAKIFEKVIEEILIKEKLD
jgi:5'-methylthioadenosine phosphorylase